MRKSRTTSVRNSSRFAHATSKTARIRGVYYKIGMVEKKRCRTHKNRHSKFSDHRTLEQEKILDDLRVERNCNVMLRKIFSSASLSRSARSDRARYNGGQNSRETNLLKKYFTLSDTVVVFSENYREDTSRLKNNTIIEEKPKIVIPFTTPTEAVCVPVTAKKPYDYIVRKRSAFSDIFVPAYDLLPSPAMFNLQSYRGSETNRFMQEMALNRMEEYVKINIDKVPLERKDENLMKKIKTCQSCKTDHSPYFKLIDAKNNMYYCDKCITRKRHQDWSKIDLFAALKKYDRQIESARAVGLNVPVKPQNPPARPTIIPQNVTYNMRTGAIIENPGGNSKVVITTAHANLDPESRYRQQSMANCLGRFITPEPSNNTALNNSGSQPRAVDHLAYFRHTLPGVAHAVVTRGLTPHSVNPHSGVSHVVTSHNIPMGTQPVILSPILVEKSQEFRHRSFLVNQAVRVAPTPAQSTTQNGVPVSQGNYKLIPRTDALNYKSSYRVTIPPNTSTIKTDTVRTSQQSPIYVTKSPIGAIPMVLQYTQSQRPPLVRASPNSTFHYRPSTDMRVRYYLTSVSISSTTRSRIRSSKTSRRA